MNTLNKLAIESGIFFSDDTNEAAITRDDLLDFAMLVITQYQKEVLSFQMATESNSLDECLANAEVQLLE